MPLTVEDTRNRVVSKINIVLVMVNHVVCFGGPLNFLNYFFMYRWRSQFYFSQVGKKNKAILAKYVIDKLIAY